MAFSDQVAISPIPPPLPRVEVQADWRAWGVTLTGALDSSLLDLYRTLALIIDEVTTLGTTSGSSTPAAHVTTHYPGGTDPLLTGTPVAVGLAALAPGVSTSLARADHVHTLDTSIAPTWTGGHTFGQLATFSQGLTALAAIQITPTYAAAVPFVIRSVVSTHMRVEYDASNYLSVGISSAGVATFTPTGTSAGLVFDSAITCGNVTSSRTGVPSWTFTSRRGSDISPVPAYTFTTDRPNSSLTYHTVWTDKDSNVLTAVGKTGTLWTKALQFEDNGSGIVIGNINGNVIGQPTSLMAFWGAAPQAQSISWLYAGSWPDQKWTSSEPTVTEYRNTINTIIKTLIAYGLFGN